MEESIRNVDQFFMDMVASLVVEVCAMDGVISPVISTDKKGAFYKSVHDFVRSIGYPHKYSRGATEFGASVTARIHLVNFLLSEYQSCKMLGPNEPEYASSLSTAKKIKLSDRDRAVSKYLGDICNVLGVECPDSAVSAIKNVQQQIKTIVSKLSDNGKLFIGQNIKPILHCDDYSEQMMDVLESINEQFSQHYSLRKNVLRKRMEVTIESMLESDRAKQQKADLIKGLNQRLSALDTESGDLLDLEEYEDSSDEDQDHEDLEEEKDMDGEGEQ